MRTIQDLAQSAAASAQRLGIKKYDVYGSSVDGTSVQVDQGEPKQVKASQQSSVIVRVWTEGGRLGVTSTTDVDEAGLALALQTAQEASAFGATEHIPDFSPAAMDPLPVVAVEPGGVAPVPTLVEALVMAEQALLTAHPAIAAVPYNNLSQQQVERFYLNSQGALRQEARSYVSMYLYTKTEQEGRKPRSAGAYRLDRSLETLDIAGCLAEARDKTLSHLDYIKIESGQYPVVLSGEAFLSLIGAFSNLFNAQSVLDNRSLSTVESLGQAIAAPILSVYDDALHPANVAAETFDEEGTPTGRLPIITGGILQNFLHSAGTAKRLNAKPTGHAGIGAKVSVGANFYHVEATPETAPADAPTLATADGVIYIDEFHALHAGVSALEGAFSLPFDGWLLKQGERVSIESATVAGDFRTLLKAITHIEAEPELTPSGLCPRVWIDSLSITGEA